jgi:transmembrane sensor
MSNVYQLPGNDSTAEACEWLARIDRGLTEQEARQLQDWLAADPRRSKALIESASLWDKMASLSRLADLFPKPAPRRFTGARVGYALAASLLLFVMVAVLMPSRGPVTDRQAHDAR